MLITLKNYLDKKFPDKQFEYRSHNNHITIYVNGELVPKDYDLYEEMKLETYIDTENLQIHYPEIIIKDDKKYNVNEKYDNKNEIEFFTIHIKDFNLY